jgi:dsDNA-specific endonuclease/ATPase MutS2
LTATEATEASYQTCDDESAVKISQLFGLRHHLIRKEESTLALMEEIRSIEYLMNYTVEGIEELKTTIENMSTAEIRSFELSQTCDTNIPRDCCQVSQKSMNVHSSL